jgi:hypothetical protein
MALRLKTGQVAKPSSITLSIKVIFIFTYGGLQSDGGPSSIIKSGSEMKPYSIGLREKVVRAIEAIGQGVAA